jgi:tripartite-type tricarboxylate transporter receptor subunit TctC
MLDLFAKEGAEPTTLSPQQTAEYVKHEVERWKQVARTGRIQVN